MSSDGALFVRLDLPNQKTQGVTPEENAAAYASGPLENVRWKFGSPLEAIRQEWALSSKETVATVSPASLVKFVIFVDISASPHNAVVRDGLADHWRKILRL